MGLKLLYNEIKNAIETNVPEIKTTRFWNNQFERDNIELAFPYPNAFVEFSNIIWQNKNAGLQSGSVEITIHLGFESYQNENTEFLDITQKVFQALNGLSHAEFSPIVRLTEQQDIDHNNIIVWRQTYSINELLDLENYVHKCNTEINISTIEFAVDLDIDNPVIRTGDGI